MAALKHAAYTISATTALSTELNSLANNANCSASSAIDNTSNLDLEMEVELVLAAQGSARSTGAQVFLYIVRSLDGGSNYADVLESINDPIAVFTLDAATTARREVKADIRIPPGLFKLYVRNATGQAFAASGSTIRYRTRQLQIV